MLSISNVSDSKKSTDYFCKDDYYLNEEAIKEHQLLSEWYGKGAAELGLTGNIIAKDYQDILSGKIASKNITLGKINSNGELDHAPGIDLTFQAPKSVSILSEVLEDKKIREIHNQSVNQILDYIEKNYIYTRVKINQKTNLEQTQNIIAAKFLHNTNRNLEPHLHTHCLLANITKKDNGDYRSAWFKKIFDDKIHLGGLYRHILKENLLQNGYNIRDADNKKGNFNFEISSITDKQIALFSTRREEILEKTHELSQENQSLSDAKLKQLATILTRKYKNVDIAHEEIKNHWQNKAQEINLPNVEIKKNISHDNSNYDSNAALAISNALDHVTERKTVFFVKEIIDQALSNKFHKTDLKSVVKEIQKLKDNNHLLPAKRAELVDYFTTKGAYQKELEILKLTKEVQNDSYNIINIDDSIKNHITNKISLNESQIRAANFILKSKDRVIGIEGYAGTGKTYMLNCVNQVAEKQGYKLLGMSPTGVATVNLKEKGGMNSITLQSFLTKWNGIANNRGTLQGIKDLKEKFSKTIIIVDEASMISSTQMKDLLTISKRLELKTILLGDTKQLDGVEAGVPFHEMVRNNLRTEKITQIIRQNNENLKQSVYDIINNKVSQAFANIENNVIETTTENIPITAAEKFLSLSDEDQKKTIIVSPTNQEKDKINEIISKELYKKRKLLINFNKINEHEIYKNKNLTEAEKTLAHNFTKGDIILPNKERSTLKIKKNEYFEVTEVKTKNNIITIKKINKSIISKALGRQEKTISFDPAKIKGKDNKANFEVFTNSSRIFHKGDEVSFTRSIKEIGVINSDQAQILSVGKNHIKVKLEKDGRKLILEKNKFTTKHLEHSYAISTHKSQGLTKKNVIALVDSNKKLLTTQKNFYVQISRAEENAFIITNNKEAAINKLEKDTGIEISAISQQREITHKVSYIEDLIVNKNHPIDQTLEKYSTIQDSQKFQKEEPILDTKIPKNNQFTNKKEYHIPDISEYEIKQHFLEAIKEHPLIDDASMKDLDKAFENLGTKTYYGKKLKNVIVWHGQAGYVANYKTNGHFDWGIGKINKKDLQLKTISLEELKKMQEKAIERKIESARLDKKNKDEKAKLAKNIFYSINRNDGLEKLKNNQYLKNKNISNHVVNNIKDVKFTKDGKIVIPIKNSKNEIRGLQFICENGEKKILKGAEKQGNFFTINGKGNKIYLAEGFATAASIHQASNSNVIVCFDVHNMKIVFEKLKDLPNFSNKEFIFAADNDFSKEDNKGLRICKEIVDQYKKDYKVTLRFPEFPYHAKNMEKMPSDFNDLHQIGGIKEIQKQLSINTKNINNDNKISTNITNSKKLIEK